MHIRIDRIEVDGTAYEIVVTLVSREREIVQVGQGPGSIPIVVAEARIEPVGTRPRSVTPGVRGNEIVVILPDIPVDRGGGSIFVIVIAGGDNEIRIPAFHERRDVCFGLSAQSVVPDDGKTDRRLG